MPALRTRSTPSANRLRAILLLIAALTGSCGTVASGSYGRSLLGEPLRNAPPSAARTAELERDLDAALRQVESDPDDEDAIIWHGRRLGYLARYPEAIAVYTRGLERHPESYRLLRHRGHRFITTRQFERAIADLEQAEQLMRGLPDRIEPDGAPNPSGIPIGTDRGNILYHLGLAQYLAGDFESAAGTFARRARGDRNPDNRASSAYWRYLALCRIGRFDEALAATQTVAPDAPLLENFAYRDLVLLFRGDLAPEELEGRLTEPVTPSISALAYGLGAWHWIEGRTDVARERWRAIVSNRTRMDAFGFIAAEAELARGADEDS